MQTIGRMFTNHRSNANRRGIAFEFSFDEWVKWWEDSLGSEWASMRGKGRGKYHMARKGDKGSYNIDNVECRLHEQNSCGDKVINGSTSWGERSGINKLTEKEVLEIFHSLENVTILSQRYDVNKSRICAIKNKKEWKPLLANEVKPINKYGRIKLNSSGFPGVTWCKRMGKWKVTARKKHLGYFSSKEDAIAARKQAENNLA